VRGTIEVGRFAERGLKCRAALVGVSGNAVISKEILSWIGGPSALWKSANKLGISTGDKIYLSHALTEKDPQLKNTIPDIMNYGNANPDVTKSFVAQVQAIVDQDNRLPTKIQIGRPELATSP
jgi:hypothetical protein